MFEAPIFLTLDEVLMIHADQIQQYGGGLGVRDLGLLQSAIAQPQATFAEQLLHAGLFEQAAAYLFHLVENHPFLDGNKRVGAASALVFLETNDIETDVDEDELVAFVLKVAQGLVGKSEITRWLQDHSHPISLGPES